MASPCKNLPIVTLPGPSGAQTIIGRRSPSAPESIEEFHGIPYGSVPGRWRHSLLRSSLPSDQYDATKLGPQCPQSPMFANSRYYQSHLDWPASVQESEFDCLNLFIVRPNQESLSRIGHGNLDNAKLPVYVIIHGGGFGFGAGTDPCWDPTRIILSGLARSKPFIAVNINYRLGVFGFACSHDIIANQGADNELQGGNFGLGDQRVALRWVSQNIAAFGGDPTKITIAGQSAGGVSVQCHVLEAKFGSQPPLFRRAVQQSGGLGTLGPAPLDDVHRTFGDIYSAAGISENYTQKEKMAALLALPTFDLLDVVMKLGWITFPCVKDNLTILDRDGGRWWVHLGQKEQTCPSILECPLHVLVGDCEKEGLHMDQILQVRDLDHLKSCFSSMDPPIPSSIVDKVLQIYNIKDTTPVAELHQSLLQFVTDRQFGYPIENARREFSSRANNQLRPVNGERAVPSEVRAYRFECGNPFPGPNQNVAHHCVDLIYIYDCFFVEMEKTDRNERKNPCFPEKRATNSSLVNAVQKVWVDFVVDEEVGGSEERAVIFDVDRNRYCTDRNHSSKWTSMIKRFDALGKCDDSSSWMLVKAIQKIKT